MRVLPLLTSTPLTGTGLGIGLSYLYDQGESSSKSQLQMGGQYSNTESITLYFSNNAFLKNNTIISNTALLPSLINSKFKNQDKDQIEYQIRTLLIRQNLLFKIKNDVYIGGNVFYKNIAYSPNNNLGEDFLYENGIIDEKSAGAGGSISLDSRENKYYPSQAYWVSIDADMTPSVLGAQDTYGKLIINARYYAVGFSDNDVWASQFYGEYSSDKTPDSGLATLSGKAVLRGFPGGQYKARFLNGAQTEYRYKLLSTGFKLTAFMGVAQLQGGSFGAGSQQRDDDGIYYAGGIGARYAIQSRTGVDLRLDVVTTSDQEESVYLALNQAF